MILNAPPLPILSLFVYICDIKSAYAILIQCFVSALNTEIRNYPVTNSGIVDPFFLKFRGRSVINNLLGYVMIVAVRIWLSQL